MRNLTGHSTLGRLVIALVIAAVLVASGYKKTGQAQSVSALFLMPLPSVEPPVQPAVQRANSPTVQPTVQSITPTVSPTVQPTVQPTPTPSILGSSFDAHLDIKAGAIELPIELHIPALKVNAPVIGVELTAANVMDAPKGPINDPIWQTAFWYRGGGIPGEPGTATIGGHVDDQIGQPQIFAHLQNLHPGDHILIHVKNTAIDIRFIVDQVKVYSLAESSDPVVLAQIYGAGPMAGTAPRPSLDGLSHLALITCEGNWVNGQFDHHTVVYATRSDLEDQWTDINAPASAAKRR